jgi:prepilin peptidase CpaA
MHGLRTAALGMLFSLAVYVPLYLSRGMGAGDVKLMAAVGAITGAANWFVIFLATIVAGGIASVVYVLCKRKFSQTILNLLAIVTSLSRCELPSKNDPELDIRNPNALRMPHGAMIAVGCVVFLFIKARS